MLYLQLTGIEYFDQQSSNNTPAVTHAASDSISVFGNRQDSQQLPSRTAGTNERPEVRGLENIDDLLWQ